MRRSHVLAGLLTAAALAVAAPAQQALQDAMRDLEDRIQGVSRWEAKRMAEVRDELRRQTEELRPYWLFVQTEQLLAENQLTAALAQSKELTAPLEKKRPEQLSTTEAVRYREALLQRGRLYGLLGEPEEAGKAALRAWKVHETVMASWRSPGRAEQQETMRTALAVALVLVDTDEQDEAARSIQRVLDAGRHMPAPFDRPEQNPFLVEALVLRSLQGARAGSHRAALEDGKAALAVLEKRLPPGTVDLKLAALQANLAQAHLALGEPEPAFAALRKADAMLTRHGHGGKLLQAEVCRLLAHLNLQQGRDGPARDAIARAHRMYKELFPEKDYPQSHPLVIQAHTSLADLLNHFHHRDAVHQAEIAQDHCQRRYRDRPHAQTVAALLTFGRCLRDAGQLSRARERFTQALEQATRLHKERPSRESDERVALCRLHLGSLLGRQGRTGEAHRLFEDARAAYDRHSGGHPYLLMTASYQGVLALQQGDREDACAAFARALQLDREQLRHPARAAAQAELLAFSQPRQLAWQGYLSASRGKDGLDEPAYRATWVSKGALTRLEQARRAAAHLARARGNEEARRALDRLVDVCARLRQAQTTGRDGAALLRLHNEMELLEVELSRFWPDAQKLLRQGEKDAGDLAAQLPIGAAFLDFVRYHDLSERALPLRYVAFLVLPGQRPRRIELGPAEPIDRTINAWRTAVDRWGRLDGEAARANEAEGDRLAAALRERLWEPIARWVPADVRLLILAPDGDLARFPFAALPGSRPLSILLEDYSIAYVPHGPQLLACLLQAKEHPPHAGRFLAVGGVAYGPAGAVPGHALQSLPGSLGVLEVAEQRSAAQATQVLRDRGATVDALLGALPLASEAHLSTHGFFDEKGLEDDRERQLRLLRDWTPQVETPVGHLALGQRFPLSYVGLALAGANEPATEYGGILTGEPISNLALARSRLVFLDACETGLGQYTAGEGVQGLQRAFHLAGCPNVIATLWRVNDAAAQALMKEFYRHLWQNRLPTLEALRQAQLSLYRSPPAGLRAGLLRGLPMETPEAGPEVRLPGSTGPAGRSPVQLWGAAYVHSGVGDPLVDLAELAERTRRLEPEETTATAPAGSSARLPWLILGGLPALTAGAVLLLRWRRKPGTIPGP